MGTRKGSDHSPIFLQCENNIHTFDCPTPFRFQPMWLTHDNFLTVVRDSWSQPAIISCPLRKVMVKLKRLQQSLKVWNNDVFGNVFSKLDLLDAKIANIQQWLAQMVILKIFGFRRFLHNQSTARFLFKRLKHKSRSSWLIDGDRNTSSIER